VHDATTRLGLDGSGGAIEQGYAELGALVRRAPTATTFDAAAYAPAAVSRLRDVWKIRMASEHQSAAVFLKLAVQMVEGRSALDAQAVMTRMALDETRHATVCGELLAAIGADPACDVPDETPPLAVYPGVGLAERVLRNVIYACALVESINVARFVATLDRTTDACVREGIRQLLSDEMHHAGFGFHYLEAATPWLSRHPEVVASLDDFLRPAFADVERAMSLHDAPVSPLTADEIALGVPDVELFREVYAQTIEHAIVPGLERLGLSATRAYRERTLVGYALAPMPFG
jgi:hypothetical protein